MESQKPKSNDPDLLAVIAKLREEGLGNYSLPRIVICGNQHSYIMELVIETATDLSDASICILPPHLAIEITLQPSNTDE
ncbi:hypothetical protein CSAL01_09538 [Colletotrichum salicis]|uniref:Uncharacterized protein n=1 Tax=Colletotrichum salicis TaxID=1209931 RepID=A0A135UGP1_9PEZI|nr:hypothetical protein CSAL01_09538 [Colletotrichum salicis]